MPVLDWTLPRKKSNYPKLYKIARVINMTDQDSTHLPTMPERPAYGTLRKVKSLNDLLDDEGSNQSSISKAGSEEFSKPSTEAPPTVAQHQPPDQTGSTEIWQPAQRRAKKSTERFIVSGFSTLSRRAGGGMEVPDINMQAVRVFLRNGTHKTIRTNPNTTCQEILLRVLKKIGLQESMILYGLYIQYLISGGRIAQDDETLSNINPNTWDSVNRIYLCRKEEFSSAQMRSRCVSFTRDFLEIEQKRRSDIDFAYDITELTNVQKQHVQVSTRRGRVATVAVHKVSVKENIIINKLIVESFAECWAKANRQLRISNNDEYIETGVNFTKIKTPESYKRKLSTPIGTLNRSYTIERGKERRPALTKMFSTGSLETSRPVTKPSGITAIPLLENVNSNNSNNNLSIPYRIGSLHGSAGKLDVHPFARPLEHSSSLPMIKISTINEEDDEIYSTLSISSLSQSDKSKLLNKLSPFSSFSSLDLHRMSRKDLHSNSTFDSSSYQSSRSQSPRSPNYQNCLLSSSKSLPSFEAISTSSDVIITNGQHRLEFGTKKISEIDQLPLTKKPIQSTLSLAPPPLPPRKHSPTTYNSNTLPLKKPCESIRLESGTSTTSVNKKQEDDKETSDSIGQMPNRSGGKIKLSRRRSISLSDLRSSLEKKSIKLTSMCNVEALKKATVMKIPGAKPKQAPQQKLIKQPENYHNVSVKELMAIRAAVTSPVNLQSPAESNIIRAITPKPLDDVSKPPMVPKRHSSLFMSSSSDEEIILQYKQMNRDSLYTCQDVDIGLAEHDDPSSCDAVATFDDDTFHTLMADQKTTEQVTTQEVVHPIQYMHDLAEPSHGYDHLDFSEPAYAISNTAVNSVDRQSENFPQKKAVDPSLVGHTAVVKDELSSSSASHWLLPSTDSHYNKTTHFGQKELVTHSKPYNTLQEVQPVGRLQYDKLKAKPKSATLKKPSCSHIYEDVDSDYEDIDDYDEEYVIMEGVKSIPPPPPLPPTFCKNAGQSKKQQQQVTTHSKSNIKSQVTVSSYVEKPTSPAPKSPVEPQIKIMVGKATKVGQSMSFQDELKSKIQTRNSDTHRQQHRQHATIQGCQHDHCDDTTGNKTPTVTKQAGDIKPSELEAKFLAMRTTHNARKEMIEKTESKLATSNNSTKRIELHNYTNMTRKFMILKEEKLN